MDKTKTITAEIFLQLPSGSYPADPKGRLVCPSGPRQIIKEDYKDIPIIPPSLTALCHVWYLCIEQPPVQFSSSFSSCSLTSAAFTAPCTPNFPGLAASCVKNNLFWEV